MTERSIVLIGLPSSGKTTFLAALWYLVTAAEVPTRLKLHRLGRGDRSHLNAIMKVWCAARVQERTRFGSSDPVVRMELTNGDGQLMTLTFPDLPGEAFTRMWEAREVGGDIADMLRAKSVVLMVHADKIEPPLWVKETTQQTRDAGLELGEEQPVEWRPGHALVQVQLVDLLQLLRSEPLDVGPRRLVVMLSAWDRAGGSGQLPLEYLREKLPLLWQYLEAGTDGWDWRAYGVSAQGGEYDVPGGTASVEAKRLREQAEPSRRIVCMVERGKTAHDLTEPLQWLTA